MTLTSRYPLPSPTITSSKASGYFHLSLIKLRTSDLICSLMYLSVSVCASVHYLLSLLRLSPRLGTQWVLNTCLLPMGVQAIWGQSSTASPAVQ